MSLLVLLQSSSGLTSVGSTRATTWAVIGQVSSTRATSWTTLASVGSGATYDSVVNTDTPWGAWDPNETSGTTIADDSGNSRPLTITGTPTTYAVAGPRSDMFGIAWPATTTDSAQTSATVSGGLATGDYAIEAWFFMSAFPAANVNLIQVQSSTTNYFGMRLLTNGVVRVTAQAGGGFLKDSPVLSTGAWHHIVAKYSNGVFYQRYDKVSSTTSTKLVALTGATVFVHGGQSTAAGAVTIGPTAFYDHALSDAASDAHYDAGFTPGGATTRWATLASVASTRATTWATLAPVTSTRATSWNTAASAASTRTSSWTVRASVAATRASTWAVLASVAATRATSWAVAAAGGLTTITATRATTWTVRTPATSTRASTWTVETSVVGARTTTWTVRAGVTSTRTTAWSALASTTSTRTTAWDTKAQAASAKATTWDTLAAVGDTRATSWGIALRDISIAGGLVAPRLAGGLIGPRVAGTIRPGRVTGQALAQSLSGLLETP